MARDVAFGESCVNSLWGCTDWSACSKSCDGGIQTRVCVYCDQIGCLGLDEFGGSMCVDCSEGDGDRCCIGEERSEVETQVCNTQPCASTCDISCGDWSPCSVSCGGGTQTRTCIRADCSLDPDEQACNSQPCGEWCDQCGPIPATTFVAWYDRSGGCDDDWFNLRSEFLCDTRCYTPNDCAANTCEGSTCDDGCKSVPGEKTCCSGDGCASNTCIGSTCWDGCQLQAGTFPPVNGSCGSADGMAVPVAPTSNLCAIGSPSEVTGSGPWYWTCGGICGGTAASCSAYKKSDSGWKEVVP